MKTCLSRLLVCREHETSQLRRERPQQTQRSAGGFGCAKTDLPQAPLMRLSTSQGQQSQGWPRICACQEQAVLGEVDPWGLRAPSTSGSPLYFKGYFALHACLSACNVLRCPVTMARSGQPCRLLLSLLSLSPRCLSRLLCLPGQVLVRALFFPPKLSLQWGVFSRDWPTLDI